VHALRDTLHTQTVTCKLKKPTRSQAHLVFADTKANAKKLKELAFSHPKIRNPHINSIDLQKSPSQNEQGKNGKFRQLH
jgi:hypothetical protein